MTAETDLLPITWADFWMSRGDTERAHDFESFSFADHYARACVSSATEALRVEVAKERDYAAQAANRVLKAELAQRKAEARAERLAEALRLIAAPIRPDGTWNRDREACRQIARDALDQT